MWGHCNLNNFWVYKAYFTCSYISSKWFEGKLNLSVCILPKQKLKVHNIQRQQLSRKTLQAGSVDSLGLFSGVAFSLPTNLSTVLQDTDLHISVVICFHQDLNRNYQVNLQSKCSRAWKKTLEMFSMRKGFAVETLESDYVVTLVFWIVLAFILVIAGVTCSQCRAAAWETL